MKQVSGRRLLSSQSLDGRIYCFTAENQQQIYVVSQVGLTKFGTTNKKKDNRVHCVPGDSYLRVNGAKVEYHQNLIVQRFHNVINVIFAGYDEAHFIAMENSSNSLQSDLLYSRLEEGVKFNHPVFGEGEYFLAPHLNNVKQGYLLLARKDTLEILLPIYERLEFAENNSRFALMNCAADRSLFYAQSRILVPQQSKFFILQGWHSSNISKEVRNQLAKGTAIAFDDGIGAIDKRAVEFVDLMNRNYPLEGYRLNGDWTFNPLLLLEGSVFEQLEPTKELLEYLFKFQEEAFARLKYASEQEIISMLTDTATTIDEDGEDVNLDVFQAKTAVLLRHMIRYGFDPEFIAWISRMPFVQKSIVSAMQNIINRIKTGFGCNGIKSILTAGFQLPEYPKEIIVGAHKRYSQYCRSGEVYVGGRYPMADQNAIRPMTLICDDDQAKGFDKRHQWQFRFTILNENLTTPLAVAKGEQVVCDLYHPFTLCIPTNNGLLVYHYENIDHIIARPDWKVKPRQGEIVMNQQDSLEEWSVNNGVESCIASVKDGAFCAPGTVEIE